MAQDNGLQMLDTTLATNGLGTLELVVPQSENIGVKYQAVEDACQSLRSYAQELTDFIEELRTAQANILSGWSGAAADEFAMGFPKLIQAFEEIPPAVQSVAEWAEATKSDYAAEDAKTASGIQATLGM